MGYQVAPKLIEVRDSQSIISDPYTLSPEQKTNLISHGYPEASTILICEEESPDRGVQTVRLGTPGIANRPGNPYPEFFRDRCGPGGFYFECYLSVKQTWVSSIRMQQLPYLFI